MPLDFAAVMQQITHMVTSLKSGRYERLEKINQSLQTLRQQSSQVDQLKKKIALSKTTWLVAEPVEKLDNVYPLPTSHADFYILATDGSHIDVDRHHSARCYLINISSVLLKYGEKPDAVITAEPRIYSDDADLSIPSPDGIREVPVEGNLLGAKRGVEECRKLAETAAKLPPASHSLALIDGTLIMWNLEGYQDFVSHLLLEEQYLVYLEKMRQLNQDRHLALASYISYPRSMDVINALRVALCPRDYVDSDKCAACKTRECYALSGIHDRELFANNLKPGERSAVFISPSRILARYGPHRVYFYYVNLENEIARVEVPMWVALDKDLIDLSHALIVDQCRRGQGYPVALSEAHEKAVVTGADRENFWQIIEASMVGEHLPTGDSAKSQSKRTRWI
ncbi:MAG: DNA double-strand break repair nuclease NurA [Dehalococcoidales bacterium]|nr:DNA double-strand break repair nuclease NurA [Dehalococcoidales bacterium]